MAKKKSTQDKQPPASGEVSAENPSIFSDEMEDDLHNRANTGEIDLSEPETQTSRTLGRLRATLLTSSELYVEAQQFQPQCFDISSLILSQTPNIVINTLEILKLQKVWYREVFYRLLDENEKIRLTARRYLMAALTESWLSCVFIVDDLLEIAGDAKESYRTIADDIRIKLCSVLNKRRSDTEDIYPAITKLCSVLSPIVVNRMLYDPEAGIRIAAIRGLMERSELAMDDLSITIILLKDKDEKVNIHLMKLYSKFVPCPEIVIPQVLPLLQNASAELREEILELFRSYGNDAIDPLINALKDTDPAIEAAVTLIIARSPLRYTDALLHALTSVRTRDDVRKRLGRILRNHQDPGRKADIMRKLKAMFDPDKTEYPEWQAPNTEKPKYLERAVQNDEIYKLELPPDQIQAFSAQCSDETLLRLLNDASTFARINAFHVIEARKSAPDAAISFIHMWMKAPDVSLAQAAMNAFVAIESDNYQKIEHIVQAVIHTDSDEVRIMLASAITKDQADINTLIDLYYQSPKRYENFILKLIRNNPSNETMKGILAGLNRDQSVECVCETIFCLLRARCLCDTPKLRDTLISLVKDPVSYGHYGLISRVNSLKLLKIWIEKDEPRNKDRKTVDKLVNLYQSLQNAELKTMIRELLRFMEEEDAISDSEDEYDE